MATTVEFNDDGDQMSVEEAEKRFQQLLKDLANDVHPVAWGALHITVRTS